MDRRSTTGCSRTDEEIPPVPPIEWDPNCTCLICQAFFSSWAMDRLERQIMELVGDVLAHGWRPSTLLAEVGHLAQRGPFAEEILTIAFVAHAGHWLSRPDKADQLAEVDELASGLHYEVGLTIPGWLQRYGTEEVAVDLALEGVVDLLEILPGLPCPPPARRRSALRTVPES